MPDQLEIFPVEKQIPQWIADYFYKANAGSYVFKNAFYCKVKPNVLSTYGVFAGYDLQIIEKKCHACSGTGVFKIYHYENGHRYLLDRATCWYCDEGIYQTQRIYLKRYVLNGRIYHIPLSFPVNEPVISTIPGTIEHEAIDPKEALRAYIILLWYFDKQGFTQYIKDLVVFDVRSKCNWITSFLQSLIRKGNTNDELPF